MEEPKLKPIPSENHGVDKKFLKLPHHKILFKPPFTLHVEGMIGSGKTTFAWSLLKKHYKNYFDEVVVYCGTLDSKHHWEKLPYKNVVVLNEWNPEEFDKYITQLETDQEERKEEGKRMLNVMILFDDMAAQGLAKTHAGKNSPLEHLMLVCRHLNVSVAILTQDSKICMKPAMRNNCFFHVLYRVQRNDIEKIAKEHSGDMTPEEFIRLYYRVMDLKPYNFLIIDYKAKPSKRFRMGFTKVIRPVTNKEEQEILLENNK